LVDEVLGQSNIYKAEKFGTLPSTKCFYVKESASNTPPIICNNQWMNRDRTQDTGMVIGSTCCRWI